jgi:carboxymethylenebutenolidase
MIDGLDEHLRATGVNARIEWYPGTHHGFAFPTRGPVYDKPAAERHWERLIALYRRRLG